jgi:serine/threonine protein kinase
MIHSKASAIFRLRASGSTTGIVRKSTEHLGGYVSLLPLPGDGRAEVSIGVGANERTLEHLVIAKRFKTGSPRATWTELDRELELAARLDHPSLIQTLRVEGVGSDTCRYTVTEYLDGMTLHKLLDSVATEGWPLPAAAVTRILISLLDAVHHGQQAAPSQASRRLCELPIVASDVFVTHDGRVKVLGFKTERPLDGGGAQPAVDLLLSQGGTPRLAQLLACYACAARSRDRVASKGWGATRSPLPDPSCEGRVELAEIMKRVNSVGRARQAARLVAAFARWRGEHTRPQRMVDDDLRAPP